MENKEKAKVLSRAFWGGAYTLLWLWSWQFALILTVMVACGWYQYLLIEKGEEKW